MNLTLSEDLLEHVADLVAEKLKDVLGGEASSFATVEEAAEHLGCSVDHVRALYRRGEIRAFRPGRRVLVDRASLDDYVRSVPA